MRCARCGSVDAYPGSAQWRKRRQRAVSPFQGVAAHQVALNDMLLQVMQPAGWKAWLRYAP
ncbi:hypothetical protein URH17368_2641 [Alicyclobacillus hesperidum URH17-3-68]|nr:hypothetical protein URH17368_2641 [Alicyclobacillus hesperidum URH17-3-68]